LTGQAVVATLLLLGYFLNVVIIALQIPMAEKTGKLGIVFMQMLVTVLASLGVIYLAMN
jgi:hypothetical protein